MSRMTRSGTSWGSFCSAIRPLAAVPTTSSAGSADSSSETSLRKTTESSTTRMRALGMESLREHVEHAELGDQHVAGERFHEVLVGPGIERPRHLLTLGLGGHHEDADGVEGMLGTDGADEVQPVHDRHV